MVHGYGTMQKATLNGRALEREVFARITARLATADETKPGGAAQLAAALDDNRRLWSALAVDLAHPDNPLSDALKAGLIGLAAFVERQTPLVATGRTTRDVLIDVNRDIIGGLGGPAMSQAA